MTEAILILVVMVGLSLTYAGVFCWGYVTGRHDEQENIKARCK